MSVSQEMNVPNVQVISSLYLKVNASAKLVLVILYRMRNLEHAYVRMITS